MTSVRPRVPHPRPEPDAAIAAAEHAVARTGKLLLDFAALAERVARRDPASLRLPSMQRRLDVMRALLLAHVEDPSALPPVCGRVPSGL